MWEELVGFRESVFCLCLGFTRSATDARDLTQETYAKALTHVTSTQNGHLKAWILRIARNTCLDHERRKRIRSLLKRDWAPANVECRTPETHASDQEQILIVRKAIQRLPRRLRETLVLREYSELSYVEIGQVLKIDVGTVMSRLNRARQCVLRFYQEEHNGTGN